MSIDDDNDDEDALRIVSGANELAKSFYKLMGYAAGNGYRFDRASHPQERLCWRMACEAYEHIEGTSPDDALSELGE